MGVDTGIGGRWLVRDVINLARGLRRFEIVRPRHKRLDGRWRGLICRRHGRVDVGKIRRSMSQWRQIASTGSRCRATTLSRADRRSIRLCIGRVSISQECRVSRAIRLAAGNLGSQRAERSSRVFRIGLAERRVGLQVVTAGRTGALGGRTAVLGRLVPHGLWESPVSLDRELGSSKSRVVARKCPSASLADPLIKLGQESGARGGGARMVDEICS